jgi:hypothetical protein
MEGFPVYPAGADDAPLHDFKIKGNIGGNFNAGKQSWHGGHPSENKGDSERWAPS